MSFDAIVTDIDIFFIIYELGSFIILSYTHIFTKLSTKKFHWLCHTDFG